MVGFVAFGRQIEVEENPPARPAAAVIALTGGADRIHDAIELLERGYAGRLLISGVNQALTLADVARLAPKYRKLVDCCVDFAAFVAATDGQYAAIDLNPVFVCDKGKGVRIADALIVTR